MHDADQHAAAPHASAAAAPHVPSAPSASPEPPAAPAATGGSGPTGDAAVDDALTQLSGLDSLPVREHVAVLDTVHAALQDRLADVED